jgi:hypothetical protein
MRIEEPVMVRLTQEELLLVVAYRKCCGSHQESLAWFIEKCASNCKTHTPANLVVLVPAKLA